MAMLLLIHCRFQYFQGSNIIAKYRMFLHYTDLSCQTEHNLKHLRVALFCFGCYYTVLQCLWMFAVVCVQFLLDSDKMKMKQALLILLLVGLYLFTFTFLGF